MLQSNLNMPAVDQADLETSMVYALAHRNNAASFLWLAESSQTNRYPR